VTVDRALLLLILLVGVGQWLWLSWQPDVLEYVARFRRHRRGRG
jgi:hypothetical protein